MVGRLAQFWSIIRELDPRDVEVEISRVPAIRLIGEDPDLVGRVAWLIFGGRLDAVECVGLDGATAGERDLNLLVLQADRPPTAEERAVARALPARRGAAIVVLVAERLEAVCRPPAADLLDFPPEHVVTVALEAPAVAQRCLIEALVQLAPEWRLGLARHFPAFRHVVASALVRETSHANAQFALFSSLPALIPLAGGLVGNAADLLVLTKNQALLLLKLAGIYERDLSARTRLLAELAPVVGGAWLWRSLARSLIGLVPSVAAAVPKTAVAFLATYLVGEMARYYYHYGQRPDRRAIQQIREEGWRVYRSIARFRPRHGGRDHQ